MVRRLALGLPLVLLLGGVHHASAHVAINILILSPAPSARAGPDVDAILLAQRTLEGVEETRFSLTVDGRRVVTDARIRVDQRRRIDLGRLSTGAHLLELSYLPDVDALPRRTSVRFKTTADQGLGAVSRGVIALAIVTSLLGVVTLVRRGRRLAHVSTEGRG